MRMKPPRPHPISFRRSLSLIGAATLLWSQAACAHSAPRVTPTPTTTRVAGPSATARVTIIPTHERETSTLQASSTQATMNTPGGNELLAQGQVTSPFGVAWSPDGNQLAVTSATGLYLFDPLDLSDPDIINSGKPLEFVGYSPDGMNIAASDNGVDVYVWNAATKDLVNTNGGFMNGIYALRYDRSGRLLVASQLGPAESLAVFSLFGNSNGGGLSIPGFEFGDPVALSPSGDEGAAPSGHGTIAVWNGSNSLVPRMEISVPASPVNLVYSPDGFVLGSVDEDCRAGVWDLRNGESTGSFEWCAELPRSMPNLAFSLDGKLLAVANNQGEVIIWDNSSSTVYRQMKIPEAKTLGIAFGPQGSSIAVLREDGLLQIWDLTK